MFLRCTRLCPSIPQAPCIQESHFLLGDFMWIKGKSIQAIQYNSNAEKLSFQYFNTILKEEKTLPDVDIRALSIYNKALYKRFMYDLEAAENDFLRAEKVAEEIQDQMVLISSWNNIALLKAIGEQRKIASNLMGKVYDSISLVERSTWSRGWIRLTLGHTHKILGNIRKACEEFSIANEFAQETGYLLVKAGSLIGLAETSRFQQDFDRAVVKHLQSIEILEKISSNPYLAEAHFQTGLTYKQINKVEQSHQHFQKAIRLFEDIQAPQQVERTKQTINKL
jgi:tetratricopeptide (TPR) repeat protein